MTRIWPVLGLLLSLVAAAGAEDFVYVFPDGQAQWGPNVNAKRVPLTDLPEDQQQMLLQRRQNAPSMKDRIREYSEKFTPVLTSAPATGVHVLLACDTNDVDTGAGVKVDLQRMKDFFVEAFKDRKEDFYIDCLEGDKLSADAIIGHYQKLNSGATETLVFFYSGHGGDSPLGHALKLSDGSFLLRKLLLAEMEKRPHQCLIIITDCCSNTTTNDEVQRQRHREKIKQLLKEDPPIEMPAGLDARTVESLFLRHSGTINFTAAAPSRDQFSWTTPETGGYFTYSLVRALRSDVNLINKGQRRRVDNQCNWEMVFNSVRNGAAWMSLGRRDAPPVDILMAMPVKDRDRTWQQAHAFSFH